MITLTLGKDRFVWDGSKGPNVGLASISAGTHPVERIPNPLDENKCDWLVIRGTKVGAPILWLEHLRDTADPLDERQRVTIENHSP